MSTLEAHTKTNEGRRTERSRSLPELRFPEFDGEWTKTRVGNLVSLTSGFAFKSEYFGEEGEKLLTPKNFTKSGFASFTEQNTKYTIEECDPKFMCKKNDLLALLTDLTPSCELLGKPVILTEKALLNQRIVRIEPKDDLVNKAFLANVMLTNAYHKWVRSTATGTTVRHSSNEILKKFSTSIPSLPEQQKIASFLSVVDEKIQQLSRKKALLEQYKKGVMQQIFSQQIRFKDENGNPYPDWEEKRVEDVFTVTRGKVLAVPKMSQTKNSENPFPVYSSQTKDRGLTGYYSDFLFENAITWTTDGANAGKVVYRQGKFYCTNVCGVLLSEEGHANQCLAQILDAIAYKFVSYVGNPKLMNNVMAEIKIRFPKSLEEQNKVASFLGVIDQEILKIEEQIFSSQEFKKGLLQKMFV